MAARGCDERTGKSVAAHAKAAMIAACLLLALASPASASDLGLGLIEDSILLGAGLGFSGTTEFLLQPKHFPEPGALALADVNPVDRVAVLPYSKGLRSASDVLMYVSVAVPFALAAIHDMNGFPAAGVVSLEALSLANGTKNAVKILLPRYRPYMYRGGAADVDRREDDESFPSGHATIAFTTAALSAYLFTSYYPDSPLLVPFLVADYALAGLTASLRVASGMHFVTDVVVGAVIGTAFGFLLPVLHQR
jgi:membrane-associated phospholipid phosphatase